MTTATKTTAASDILTALSKHNRDDKVRILTVLGADQRMHEYYLDRNERRYDQAREEFIAICDAAPESIIKAAQEIGFMDYDGDYSKLLMEI